MNKMLAGKTAFITGSASGIGLEIADYAVFLASDKGRGITGLAVVLDGGYTAQ